MFKTSEIRSRRCQQGLWGGKLYDILLYSVFENVWYYHAQTVEYVMKFRPLEMWYILFTLKLEAYSCCGV